MPVPETETVEIKRQHIGFAYGLRKAGPFARPIPRRTHCIQCCAIAYIIGRIVPITGIAPISGLLAGGLAPFRLMRASANLGD